MAATVTQWLSCEKRSLESRGLLLSGPPGIGKTSLVRVVAESLGFHVAESNASDARTVSLLRGQIALGMRRLRKEVVVMDEVDGLCERGGVAELADLIRRSPSPVICIANAVVPAKMAPLTKVCLHVKMTRPSAPTIATALDVIAKKEGVSISKEELRAMVEESGNDIRSVLNRLQMHGSTKVAAEKDASLRLDLFSATQKLMSHKKLAWTEAEDLVYVDSHMVPLMVQEAYLTASRSLEEAATAAERISEGDLFQCHLWKSQDWSILPHVVGTTVSVAKMVSGPAPFQIFPKLLGKNSSKMKHIREMNDIGRQRGRSGASFRMEEADSLYQILARPLMVEPAPITNVMERMDAAHVSRDDLLDSMEGVVTPMDIPTKTKSALTRLYNKTHGKNDIVHRKGQKRKEMMDSEDEESEEEDDDLL